MKLIYLIAALDFMIMPVWADEDLRPEPMDQAIGKYQELLKSRDVDPMNREIWKIYIFYELTPSDEFDKTPKWIVGGLTPDRRYRVILPINQLYNYLSAKPNPGDVVVVEGRVTSHYDVTVDFERGLTSKRATIPAFLMYVEGALNLPHERFDPNVHRSSAPTVQFSPTPTPGGGRR